MSGKYLKDVEQWLDFARYDLLVAREHSNGEFYTSVCFDCQQAAEKALKAALLHYEITIVRDMRTHDLRLLLQHLTRLNSSYETLSAPVMLLIQYYITTRYPTDLGGPDGMYDSHDADGAIQAAEAIMKFIRQDVGMQ